MGLSDISEENCKEFSLLLAHDKYFSMRKTSWLALNITTAEPN